jgi:hypothetical protein
VRSRGLLLAMLVVVFSAAPRAASADPQVLGVVGPYATGLTAYGGHVVWSERDPIAGRHRLMRWHAGITAPLPTASRGDVFDVDVGPDRGGHPVAVYSRCRTFGAPGAEPPDCHLRRLRLDTGADAPLRALSRPAGSETDPAIWRGAIAFARYQRGAAAVSLHLHQATGGRAVRLPRGTTGGALAGSGGVARIHDIDLDSRTVVFVWGNTAYGGHEGYEARAVDRKTRQRVLLGLGESGEGNLVRAFSPNAGVHDLLWSEPATNWTPQCSYCYTRAPILAFDRRRRSWRESASTPGTVLEVARDHSTLYALRHAEPLDQVCLQCLEPPAKELVKLDAPTFGPPTRARARLRPLDAPQSPSR